jgi:response regulator RpfG family c-di-GMP phosphodiesterase
VQRNFLVVAHSGKLREALAANLRKRGFTVTLAGTEAEAVQVVRSVAVDVVLIESRQPDARVRRARSRILRERPDCQVFVVTNFDLVKNTADLLRFGAQDYIVDMEVLLDLAAAPLQAGRGSRDDEQDKGTRGLIQVLDVLVGLLELDDRYFGGFSHQVMRLARVVAEEMGLESEVVAEVVIATLLRDIGKVGVHEEVLFEEKEFSNEQTDKMREHVTGSVRLLEHIDFPWKIIPVIRHHHERYDGKGYPDGLKGREIPLGGRIVAAVDAYMAMISDRPHRQAMTAEEALVELERQAGAHFDPEVVEVLIRVVEKHHTSCGLGQKPSVLVIDHQEEFRRLLKMRLLNEGFEIHAIPGLEDDLESIAETPPHLILAGAGEDGAETLSVLRTVREDERLGPVPFVFVAHSDDRVLKLRALRHGVDDFLLRSDDLEEMVARIENILTREAQRRNGAAGRRRRGITGQIENLALPDIVQILSIGMKTARVTIDSGSTTGKLWVKDGTIVHARLGPHTGETAFYEMLRFKDGEFAIEHGVKTTKRTIQTDAMFLVMEGLRRLDEESVA